MRKSEQNRAGDLTDILRRLGGRRVIRQHLLCCHRFGHMLVPIDNADQACAKMPRCGFDDGAAQTGPRVELVQDEALIGGLRCLAIGIGSAVYYASLECRDQLHGRGIYLQDRDQQIGHRQEGGKQWRWARRSVHN